MYSTQMYNTPLPPPPVFYTITVSYRTVLAEPVERLRNHNNRSKIQSIEVVSNKHRKDHNRRICKSNKKMYLV